LALATALGLLAATSAQAGIVLNFNGNANSNIQFVGDGTSATVTIQPNSDPHFTVSSTTGGDGSGAGITGSIVSSGFTYNASDITSVIVLGQTLEVAPLAGTGVLTLSKGGETLTADITGGLIATLNGSGAVNTTQTVNLSNLVLTGTGNNDLTQFYNEAIATGGIGTLTFQFANKVGLDVLVESGTNTTSYSGSLTSAVPEPATVGMGLSAVVLLGVGYIRRRKLA